MKLSLIIAIYNIEDYLEDCINSIVIQNLTDCEVLLIDDGATDGCSEICKKYALKHEQVKYLHKENGGLGSARNYGLNYAQGDYIWFIDGDDEITKNSIEELLLALSKLNSDIIMFHALHKRLKEENLRLESDMQYIENYGVLDFFDKTKSFPVAVWSFLYNKKFLKDNTLLFDDNMYYEDNHFMYRAYNNAGTISSLNQAFYIYKAREGSIMKSNISEKKLDSIYKIIILLDELQPDILPEILLKNKLFFHINQYVILNSQFIDRNLNDLFLRIPKQKIFSKDPKGIIWGKLLYNFNKKLFLYLVLKRSKN